MIYFLKNFKHSNERGNALWFILLAVALLGVLTFTVTRSGSNVEDSGNQEQARVKASQVLRYLSALESAVDHLLLSGDCSENEISFKNDIDTTYTNGNSPPDETCHVFETAGRGLRWQSFSSEQLAGGHDMMITGALALYGQNIGTADSTPDLIAAIPVVQPVCLDINQQLGITTVTADITSDINVWNAPYIGAFARAFDLGDAAGEAAGLAGYGTGCFIDDAGQHVAYHVLLAR